MLLLAGVAAAERGVAGLELESGPASARRRPSAASNDRRDHPDRPSRRERRRDVDEIAGRECRLDFLADVMGFVARSMPPGVDSWSSTNVQAPV